MFFRSQIMIFQDFRDLKVLYWVFNGFRIQVKAQPSLIQPQSMKISQYDREERLPRR